MANREPCAGAIVLDDQRRLLVIRRAHDPSAGRWSIPGGRCLPGEDPETACKREVQEETGLIVEVVRRAGRVVLDAPGGAVYDVEDFECMVIGGELAAGDDASEVRWASMTQLQDLPCVAGLLDHLTGWGLAPA